MKIKLNHFYKFLKQRRIELGISQQELANALGYTTNVFISKVEANKAELPLDKWPELLRTLKVNDFNSLEKVKDAMILDIDESMKGSINLDFGKRKRTRRTSGAAKEKSQPAKHND